MTTTTARRAKGRTTTASKSRKPARTAEGVLPMHGENNDKLDFKAVLVEALSVPGKMSNAFSRFYRYSFLNMLLVFMQTGKLEPMGNFKFWTEKMGRKIVSGSGSALFVNHPYPVYKRDEAGNVVVIDGRKVIAFMRFYPKASVFQLFQTDGPELVLPELPDWNKDMALKSLDITEVPFSDGDGNVQGYSIERKLALNPVAAAPFKTLIHEIAHIVLGHTDRDSLKEYQQHRGIREFQAEATALLVCKELDVDGFDDSASRAYIQSWLSHDGRGASAFLKRQGLTGKAELIDDEVVREIFAATDKILVAGRKRHFEKLAEESAA